MASVEERMKILKMVEEGKISAEEGTKLLAALSAGGRSNTGPSAPTRWLRIRVTDTDTGRSKASVNIPLSLMDAGLKIGAHFVPQVGGMELEQLRTAVRSGVSGKIIDVMDGEGGQHVEIFID